MANEKVVRNEKDVRNEKVVRRMITREDELTNQRMLWTAAFNGLLFTALGFAWGKSDTKFLLIVFSILGYATSFLNCLALLFSTNAQRRLLFWWKSNMPEHYSGPGVMGGEPPHGERLYAFFFTPWILLASSFAFGWLAILLFILIYVK